MSHDHKADIIVIGASAGGVEAMMTFVAELKPDFQAAIFVTIHQPARGVSRLPEVLSHNGPLPASHPMEGSPIQAGHIYVAPPNRHLLVHRDRIELGKGPKKNGQRPCIDVMFRSVALAYGPRVIGILLTGALDDGSAGLWEIKQRGGKAIVQDPKDALFPDMPRNAMERVPIDYVMPLRGLAPLVTDMVGQPVVLQENTEGEPMTDIRHTVLTCPDCRGPISESRRGSITEFACRVGHRYSPMTFLAAHAETRERVLWAAVVALEEGADIAHELAAHSTVEVQRLLEQEANNNARSAEKIRDLLLSSIQESAGI